MLSFVKTAARTFATRYDHDRLSRVFKSSVDTKKLTSTVLLSYPERDLAGDIVQPEGVEFFKHMRDPRIDLEHRHHPDFGDATVAWAHSGYGRDDGEYSGRHVMLKCGDADRPLPVGTNYFDPSDRLQVQTFALQERGILPDVSLEFIPDDRYSKSLGKSPLEPRDAYEFGRVSVVRWTLCAKGVCPSATVLKSVHDPLRSVLSANRIGGEQLHPTIFKALSHYMPGKASTVTSGYSVEKADMDPYGNPSSSPAPDAPPAEPAVATNGITALYNHAQSITDLCDQLERDAESTDSAEVMKDIKKQCEAMRAMAEKVMTLADKHDAKLESAKGGKEEGEADSESEPGESDPDMSRDDEGNLKAIPQKYAVVVKSLRAARYSLAEVQKAESEQAAKVKVTRRTRQDEEDEALVARARQLGAI